VVVGVDVEAGASPVEVAGGAVVDGALGAGLEDAPDDPALQPASASIASSAAGATGRDRIAYVRLAASMERLRSSTG
jgi:hypothetical protein